MRRRVVDASVLVDALLPTPRRTVALRALSTFELWAPGILDLEVASAIARLERAAHVTATEATTAVRDLASMPIERIDLQTLTPRAWQLRGSLRISDAFYISAAEAIGGDLITSDRRLANAPALTVPVTLLPLI